MPETIKIEGVNFRNLVVPLLKIPTCSITLITGDACSGKSTLLKEVLAAESTYRLKVLHALTCGERFTFFDHRPRCRAMKGLRSVVLADQLAVPHYLDTVASFLEIDNIILKLWEGAKVKRCPACGGPVSSASLENIYTFLNKNYSRRMIAVTTKLPAKQGSEAAEVRGFERFLLNGREVEPVKKALKNNQSSCEIIIDMFRVSEDSRSRIRESLQMVKSFGQDAILVYAINSSGGKRLYEQVGVFKEAPACIKCGQAVSIPTPEFFNFRLTESYTEGLPSISSLKGPAQFISQNKNVDETLMQATLTLLNTPLKDLSTNQFELEPHTYRHLQELSTCCEYLKSLGLEDLLLISPLSLLSDAQLHLLKVTKTLCYALPQSIVGLEDLSFYLPDDYLKKLLKLLGSLKKTFTFVIADSNTQAYAAVDHRIELTNSVCQNTSVSDSDNNFNKLIHKIIITNTHIDKLKIPEKKLTIICEKYVADKVDPLLNKLTGDFVNNMKEAFELPTVIKRYKLVSGNKKIKPTTVIEKLGVLRSLAELYSELTPAKAAGFSASVFIRSYRNILSGSCNSCNGSGVTYRDRQPQVCQTCFGMDPHPEMSEVRFKGISFFNVFSRDLSQLYTCFNNIPEIETTLRAALKLGLGYLHAGRSTAALSLTEKRKLSLALAFRKRSVSTLYILKYPFAGLPQSEKAVVLNYLQGICTHGCTILAVEYAENC
ncbi:MAG: hypothetical protein D6719_12420 [Candidatus Dadabacteria bacterium]|nr:MAG: hypothetical protein D6719_12420 [Candidatus Dadabacteria bacterium]